MGTDVRPAATPAALLGVDEHLTRILDTIRPLTPYDVPLLDALGLPIGEDVVAAVDLPGFDNSAMDGYAVRAVDVAGAAPGSPVRLPVVGEVAAGQQRPHALAEVTTLRIMTGAPVPTGADAVVPLEWTDRGLATVAIERSPQPGAHVRPRGDDVRAGQRLLGAGDLLGPRQLALLAAVGRATVRARPRPRAVVISTGTELCEPGGELGFDQVYDANSYALAAAARAAGAVAYRIGILPDDPQVLRDALSDQLVRADLVVTSGGVSKGAYDVVKEVLARLGTVRFCEVAMQPGKPQGFGTLGEDAVPIFTLPGNPVSAYVSFEVFVVPAIRQLLGRQPVRRPLVDAECTAGFRSAVGKRQFVRARLEHRDGGRRVAPVGGHGSHLVGDLARANALIVVPEEQPAVNAGDRVAVLDLDADY